MSASAPLPAPQAAGLSEPARLMNVFFSPSKTFADVKRVGRWWAPWLLITVFSIGYVATIQQKITFEQVFQNNMKMSPKQAQRIEQLPADQRDAAVNRAVKFTEIFSYAFPVINLLLLAIVAAVLMASFNFGAGAELTYGTSLAVVMYASLPGILRVVLAVISMFAGIDPESFNIQNPVATNLGYFVDSSRAVLYRLASSLDVTMIWTLVLTAIGFACVSKMKRGTTFFVVFAWYAVWVLVTTGFAALFA